ncbi:carotenoid 1,2-hydratase [Thauera sp. GDN1]|uniref:lipocalin-like domain-containing protein n=1 Tax=Thauera sp. GDN1 TaxID=2944810 RepID=UPI002478DCEA|nr:carotenoid 1,2-hydratase [Thauera sp. GDN1]
MRLLFALVAGLQLFGAAPVQADGATPDYPPVVAGRTLAFPQDFGAHNDYRTEWWYITGWLRDAAGVERGFQLTFFRVRTRIGEDNPSRFAPRQLILAHAAVADPASGRLRHAERSGRAYPGLVEAEEGRTAVRVDDWFLSGGETPDAPYRSRVEAEDFAFELEFMPDRPPVLNGKAGFSQKAPDPLNASYYYSRPQLAVSGTLRVDGAAQAVTGHAWLDHEWSSEILPADAHGWDWIGINLHGGGGLMGFQMRDGEGRAMWGAGTLSDASGKTTVFGPEDLRFTPVRRWHSPRTGIEYPVEWTLRLVDGRRFRLQPLMDDQELDSRASTGAIYWEGAVRLLELTGAESGGGEREVGQGYLEMTGYADRLRM